MVVVSDTKDANTNRLSVIKALAVPVNNDGVKLLKTVDDWLKAGGCVRYQNCEISCMRDCREWCTTLAPLGARL